MDDSETDVVGSLMDSIDVTVDCLIHQDCKVLLNLKSY